MTDATNYLGLRCEVTAAFERFDYEVEQARGNTKGVPKEVARQIGMTLADLYDRIDHLTNSLEAVHQTLPKNTGNDPAVAVLMMGKSYGIDCCNRFGELIGLVLLALEQAGLHAPAKETCNG